VKAMPETRNDRMKTTRFRLLPTLLFSIGFLVFSTVGTVLALQWYSSSTVVSELGNVVINRTFESVEEVLRNKINAVVNASTFISDGLRSGRFSAEDSDDLVNVFSGVMAAEPQITGIVFVAPNMNAYRVLRNSEGAIESGSLNVNENPSSPLYLASKAARQQKFTFWGTPVYSEILSKTLISLRTPIHSDDRYLGFLAIAISIESLSKITEDTRLESVWTTFILFGDDNVLAHKSISQGITGLSRQKALPSLADIEDPVIRNLKDAKSFSGALLRPPKGTSLLQLDIDGDRYLIFKKVIDDYGDFPLVIGYYGLASSIGAPVRVVIGAAIAGILLLAVALIVAAYIARTISRPVRRTAERAQSIANLDFDTVTLLSHSYLKEINDLSTSFNAMTDGLRNFSRYVPKTLVANLIREGDRRKSSEERIMSVMFTDIDGFTAICEGMSANEVASFVNEHISIIAECIEDYQGTIDKYIGDSVMAFWGAPNRVKNTALQATNAGLAIRRAIEKDNRIRVSRNLMPIRLRVGIHTGRLVVGDIGSKNRINYTVVGDVVNAAQRLEGLGKEVDPEDECIVLISGQTAAQLPEGFQTVAKGSFHVKGKQEELEVYKLISNDGLEKAG